MTEPLVRLKGLEPPTSWSEARCFIRYTTGTKIKVLLAHEVFAECFSILSIELQAPELGSATLYYEFKRNLFEFSLCQSVDEDEFQKQLLSKPFHGQNKPRRPLDW